MHGHKEFSKGKRALYLSNHSANSESMEKSTSFIPIETYHSIIKLFASRSQIRKMNPTAAKISKYHILENKNTGHDICHRIINTDIGLNKHRNISFDNVIPILSPILELLKNRHNRYNYFDKLQYLIDKNGEKYINQQKYKNQIHVRLLQSFFSLILYENIPLELFGTMQNFKVIKEIIHRLLRTVPKRLLITHAFKRTVRETYGTGALLNTQPLLKKFNISKIRWLHSIKNNIEKWIIILKLLHWFFAQYIMKILHKFIVIISFRGHWVYIRKNDWCKMQEEFLKEKENTGSLIAIVKSDESKWDPPTGIYKFIPSSSNLRALLITKFNNKKQSDAVDVALRFLQQLYITYFNEEGISTLTNCQQAIFKFKKSTNKRLYFVRCDIQDAFGSIIQEKLYDIINTCCKQLPLYLVLRNYVLQKNKYRKKNKNQNKISKVNEVKTVQFLDLKSSIHKDASMVKAKPKLVKKTKLVAKIKKLIFGRKVEINGKIYAIRRGVPQGVTLSPILADIYYEHMFKQIFSIYASNGFLCKYVDDILYITENEYYATQFLKTVIDGVPEYNVKFNPSKIQSNVDSMHKIMKCFSIISSMKLLQI